MDDGHVVMMVTVTVMVTRSEGRGAKAAGHNARCDARRDTETHLMSANSTGIAFAFAPWLK